MMKAGDTIRFTYHNRNRVVKVEKVGNGWLQGIVVNENNKPRSFSFIKMSNQQVQITSESVMA